MYVGMQGLGTLLAAPGRCSVAASTNPLFGLYSLQEMLFLFSSRVASTSALLHTINWCKPINTLECDCRWDNKHTISRACYGLLCLLACNVMGRATPTLAEV